MHNRRIGVLAIWLAVVFIICGLLGAGMLGYARFNAAGPADAWFEGEAAYTESYDLPFNGGMALTIDVSHIDVQVVADGTLEGRVVAEFSGHAPRTAAGRRIDAVESGGGVIFSQVHEGSSFFIFGLDFVNDKLTVRVPSAALSAASILSTSGMIEASGLTAAGDFEARASSGAVNLQYITASNITARASSGRVALDSVHAGNNLTLSTSSGAIRCLQAEAQVIGASATSGRVTLSQSRAVASVSVETSSGVIDVDNVETLSLQTHATSGSTHLTVDAPEVRAEASSGSITVGNRAVAEASIRSSSGSVRYTAPTLDGTALDLTSSSGSIYAGGARASKSFKLDGGNGSITINTSSGSITVN